MERKSCTGGHRLTEIKTKVCAGWAFVCGNLYLMRINNGQLDLRRTHCGPGWLQNVLCILKRELVGRREAGATSAEEKHHSTSHALSHVYWFLIVVHAIAKFRQMLKQWQGEGGSRSQFPSCHCACTARSQLSPHYAPHCANSLNTLRELSFIARVMLSSVPKGSLAISFNFPAFTLKIDDIDCVENLMLFIFQPKSIF